MSRDDSSVPTAGYGVSVWASSEWRAEAVGWLDDRLTEHGLTRIGDVQQPHLRPWATALRADTDGGGVWLKAGSPGQAFEAGLYAVLQRLVPGRVLTPLGVDVDRGWLLLPDGGLSLGAALTGTGGSDRMADALGLVLAQYARLQRAMTPYTDDLLAAGCGDMSPAQMPNRYEEALAEADRYLRREGEIDGEDGGKLYQRLVGHRALFAERCAELAAGPIVATLQHDDLHAWNVFARDHERGAIFFDWGDSVVAHPFATLLVTLRSLQAELDAPGDDPRLRRVRDAYLAEFADLGGPAQLRRLAVLACHAGTVTRALTWARELRLMPSDQLNEYDGAQLRWLLLSLVDEPLVAVGAD